MILGQESPFLIQTQNKLLQDKYLRLAEWKAKGNNENLNKIYHSFVHPPFLPGKFELEKFQTDLRTKCILL